MQPEQDIAEYRERLLNSLKTGARRSTCSSSDSVQVFVNQRRVGLLDGGGGEATLQVQTDVRVENVQLRSEDGVLLGGLSAPEYGFRTSRIPLSRDTVELRVQNYAQGGSVSAVFTPEASFWHRARRAFTGVADASMLAPAAAVMPGMRAMVFTQLLLAVALVGLAADRMTGWLTPAHTPPPVTQAEAPWAAPLAEVAKLEHQLTELSRMQAKAVDTIQTQQQGMAQLQQTIAKLSSTQETVASSVLTVKQEMEQRRKGAGREVDRLTRMMMSKAQTEQEQLEAEIHSLVVANDKLSKEMSTLEQNNQDLKKRLKSAGVDVSKTTVSDREKPVVAQQAEAVQPPQVAEARPNPAQSPFLFWVTFSDGTSQESIDQWVRDMRGKKGALSEGWQAVEIVPPTEPMERFLDQIKQTKIVKAVRISR
jgi:archaellum component FlaC